MAGNVHGTVEGGGHARELSAGNVLVDHGLLVAEEVSEEATSPQLKTCDLNCLPRSVSRSTSRSVPVFRCEISVGIPVSHLLARRSEVC